ncbi:tRNA (adenosine(37)-N6)-threonylcarbamoyltransferase complex dimerization subunit type 1 TsaB [Octadecabacter sp. B2R22]|uniref:tRNA (adenosine(37)-N6)-threonylcarbamoyltransferase complex dimerization subunit type 1 TsaB n=1 Tax=unclassified Octadecabacter TaxID=196158 RepID=UPI00339D8304
MTDPVTLAFDTSGPFCAAALLRADGHLVTRQEDMTRGQGERLMVLLEELLESEGVTWADLDAIAVGTGPGNFTGIRIAVSAARGLALGLNVPAIGVSGFQSAAFGMDNVIACIPAPRDQAYVQVLVSGADPSPALIDLNDIRAFPDVPVQTKPRFCGPAALDVATAYLGRTLSEDEIAPQSVSPIEAIVRIGAAQSHATTTRPAPLYVRPADAAPSREAPPVILP